MTYFAIDNNGFCCYIEAADFTEAENICACNGLLLVGEVWQGQYGRGLTWYGTAGRERIGMVMSGLVMCGRVRQCMIRLCEAEEGWWGKLRRCKLWRY